MTATALYPRNILPRLTEALADTPVVVIHGPRRCGNTTLARMLGQRSGYDYFSFDDPVTLGGCGAGKYGSVQLLEVWQKRQENANAPTDR